MAFAVCTVSAIGFILFFGGLRKGLFFIIFHHEMGWQLFLNLLQTFDQYFNLSFRRARIRSFRHFRQIFQNIRVGVGQIEGQFGTAGPMSS